MSPSCIFCRGGLRGHPLSDLQRTGGHGGPPLQLFREALNDLSAVAFVGLVALRFGQ